MGSMQLIDVFQHMLYFTILAVIVILLPGLIVGFIVSIFQAATQINEMTLSFLPKMLVMLLVIALLAPWLMQKMIDYTENLIINLRYFIS